MDPALSAPASENVFEFPKIRSFPPFFTKQQNTTVLETQLDSWADLVLRFCEFHKIYVLSTEGKPLGQQQALGDIPPLFENPEIDRAVPSKFKQDIFDHLILKLNKAAYLDKSRDTVVLYWRLLSEWASMLYSHLSETGQLGLVLTVYELTKSEDSGVHKEFKNIDERLFIQILQLLTKQGKAQILMENGSIEGVKVV